MELSEEELEELDKIANWRYGKPFEALCNDRQRAVIMIYRAENLNT